jgi:hypothetical protein
LPVNLTQVYDLVKGNGIWEVNRRIAADFTLSLLEGK